MQSELSTVNIPADAEPQGWTVFIRPTRHWLDLRLGDLWRYRDLITLFVWRDFVANYKQTILGPVWYLVQPLLTTITFTVVFGNMAGLSTEGVPQFLFYMTGTVIWSYFATCLTRTSSTFISNAAIFGKVYFPRLIVPISILLSNLITLAVQFGQLLIFMGYFALTGASFWPNEWIVLTPVLLAMMAGLGLGFGIIVSSLTARYRDLQFLITFGVQLLMFATPVIYPLSSVPEHLRWLILANPMTSIVESFRFAYLGVGTVSVSQLAYSFACMVVFLVVGILVFNRVEQTFMDTV